MARFIQVLIGITVGALVLAAGASSRSVLGDLTVPTLLQPASNQTYAVGTPIVFQIQTHSDDGYLWLHVSRSPAVANPCGTIGEEVELESFTATSPGSSVYQASPAYSSSLGFWMNQPGTYYWQAYRIEYGGGADGCIESEVRSFTISGTPPALTPPTLLSPTPGQSIKAGTSVAFQIRTHAGDGYLWLQVSKSPVQDSCGKIASEVETERFVATSDPTVYEAKPTHFKGGWMDTAGTYYWQAYRIEYGGGADGCIESEVRSFTIKKSSTTTTTTTTNQAPRSLSAARLMGRFKIKLTVRATSGIKNVKRGRTYSERWTFTPRCTSGSCHTRASVSSLYATLGDWTLVLKRGGASYKKSQTAKIVQCFYKPVYGPLNVTVRVTKGAWIGNVWRATKITGSFRHSVGSVRSGIYHCPAGTIVATIRGSLSE